MSRCAHDDWWWFISCQESRRTLCLAGGPPMYQERAAIFISSRPSAIQKSIKLIRVLYFLAPSLVSGESGACLTDMQNKYHLRPFDLLIVGFILWIISLRMIRVVQYNMTAAFLSRVVDTHMKWFFSMIEDVCRFRSQVSKMIDEESRLISHRIIIRNIRHYHIRNIPDTPLPHYFFKSTKPIEIQFLSTSSSWLITVRPKVIPMTFTTILSSLRRNVLQLRAKPSPPQAAPAPATEAIRSISSNEPSSTLPRTSLDNNSKNYHHHHQRSPLKHPPDQRQRLDDLDCMVFDVSSHSLEARLVPFWDFPFLNDWCI